MKTFLQLFGGTLIALALMAMAGSTGDCDGKCGPGNDIGTMLFIVFWALVAFVMGAWMFIKGSQEG
tara:strand:+ start:275 stop:472 length:198 start_codon:yes stop_codon:yes gene_type:complete